MTRLRSNFNYGTITDNPLTSGATSANSTQFPGLPVVTAPDYMEVTLDPKAVNGAPEIIYVTAHTVGSSTVTIVRGQEGTAARSHPTGEVWLHGGSAQDLSATQTPTISNVGDVGATGTADPFAKSDHLHGREGFSASLPTTITVTSGAVGTSANPARSDHLHPAATSTPTTSIPTDTNAPGVGPGLSASDHKHGREGYGTPGVSSASDVVNQGSQTTVSRSDHQHGREGYGTPGTSIASNTISAGTATSLSRSDHQHGREGYGTSPVPVYYGDPGTPGVSNTVSRGDHQHPHPTPLATFGHMDSTNPSYGASSMASISSLGAPHTVMTVPPSGLIVINWAICVFCTPDNVLTDLYIGVGWGGSGRAGVWPGLAINPTGTEGSLNDSVIMSAAPIDNQSSGLEGPPYVTVSGTWYLSPILYSGLNSNTSYTFYLLWGVGSVSGGVANCNAGSRGAVKNGTWIQAVTIP